MPLDYSIRQTFWKFLIEIRYAELLPPILGIRQVGPLFPFFHSNLQPPDLQFQLTWRSTDLALEVSQSKPTGGALPSCLRPVGLVFKFQRTAARSNAFLYSKAANLQRGILFATLCVYTELPDRFWSTP